MSEIDKYLKQVDLIDLLLCHAMYPKLILPQLFQPPRARLMQRTIHSFPENAVLEPPFVHPVAFDSLNLSSLTP